MFKRIYETLIQSSDSVGNTETREGAEVRKLPQEMYSEYRNVVGVCTKNYQKYSMQKHVCCDCY